MIDKTKVFVLLLFIEEYEFIIMKNNRVFVALYLVFSVIKYFMFKQ
jgi:hypothetical protein